MRSMQKLNQIDRLETESVSKYMNFETYFFIRIYPKFERIGIK
jgi:hypothetical protein